jgi:hypothetical protein
MLVDLMRGKRYSTFMHTCSVWLDFTIFTKERARASVCEAATQTFANLDFQRIASIFLNKIEKRRGAVKKRRPACVEVLFDREPR